MLGKTYKQTKNRIKIILSMLLIMMFVAGTTANARTEMTVLNRNYLVTGGHGRAFNEGNWSRASAHVTATNNFVQASITHHNVHAIAATAGPQNGDSRTAGIGTLVGVRRFVQHIGNSFSAPLRDVVIY